MLKFQDKTALITGSGTGIGQAIAKKFVEEGASVIILGRRRGPLEKTSTMLNEIISKNDSGASVRIFFGVDVSDGAAISGMFDALVRDSTTIDYMINNAGVSGPVTCFANASMDDFKSTVDIHLTGTFWGSVQALRVMKAGGKIITISTFFTEERPLEQRPYRFRSPYTASQGAKNRLAELMSWELTEKGIISIATNPGPVHSDRIYKTVYPKAASEFMRVGGFEDLSPTQVDAANKELLPLLGEDKDVVAQGIKRAAEKLADSQNDAPKLTNTFTNLLEKIQSIAEKIQNNTSHMIANQEFLSQQQVAGSVLNLCDDAIAKTLNGKVIPGDRVFYPVKPHVKTAAPKLVSQTLQEKQLSLQLMQQSRQMPESRVFGTACREKRRQGSMFHLRGNAAGTARVHCRQVPLPCCRYRDSGQVQRWLNTAKTSIGEILAVIHVTGKLPEMTKLTELSRAQWDGLVEKFVLMPANVAQRA